MQVPPAIQIGGRQSKSQYQFTMQSPDIGVLDSAAQKMEAKMRTIPELQDVTSDLQIANPQVNVQIDRERAATLGVTAQQIEAALVRRIRLAPGLDDLHAEQSVLRDHGAEAGIPARRERPRHALHPIATRRAGPAERGLQHHAERWSARDHAFGPAAFGDDLVQHRSRALRLEPQRQRSRQRQRKSFRGE